MTWLHAAILGAVQGLTEFLPISSSGHLTLMQSVLGIEEPDVFFDVILHVGTLFAVLFYYRRDLQAMLADVVAPRVPGTRWVNPENWRLNRGRWWVILIGLATVPTGVIGFLGKDFFESLFTSVAAVGAFLWVTALILAGTWFTRRNARGDWAGWKAILVGIAQGFAILPGISRSGTTIALSLALKVRPEEAARFSFLLSIPAILGALALKLGDVSIDQLAWLPFLVGFAVSALVGYAALWLVIRLVERGRLHWFAPYCAVMGLIALALP